MEFNSHNFSFVRHVFVQISEFFGSDEDDPIMTQFLSFVQFFETSWIRMFTKTLNMARIR